MSGRCSCSVQRKVLRRMETYRYFVIPALIGSLLVQLHYVECENGPLVGSESVESKSNYRNPKTLGLLFNLLAGEYMKAFLTLDIFDELESDESNGEKHMTSIYLVDNNAYPHPPLSLEENSLHHLYHPQQSGAVGIKPDGLDVKSFQQNSYYQRTLKMDENKSKNKKAKEPEKKNSGKFRKVRNALSSSNNDAFNENQAFENSSEGLRQLKSYLPPIITAPSDSPGLNQSLTTPMIPDLGPIPSLTTPVSPSMGPVFNLTTPSNPGQESSTTVTTPETPDLSHTPTLTTPQPPIISIPTLTTPQMPTQYPPDLTTPPTGYPYNRPKHPWNESQVFNS